MNDDEELNSHELGALGEATFEAVCVTGRLIANKSGRDRSGWDYQVEFPILHVPDAELDKRQNPISSVFQTKAMWSRNDRIRFRLSSIERIAKDPRPSFVYVMKFDDRNQVEGAFLVHLRGPVLESVLRKLRKEQEAGRFAVNAAYMDMYASSVGTPVGTGGEDLVRAIEDAVGPDPAAYMEEKRNELDSLAVADYGAYLKDLSEAGSYEFVMSRTLDEDEADAAADGETSDGSVAEGP